jgi:hypothetical protein
MNKETFSIKSDKKYNALFINDLTVQNQKKIQPPILSTATLTIDQIKNYIITFNAASMPVEITTPSARDIVAGFYPIQQGTMYPVFFLQVAGATESATLFGGEGVTIFKSDLLASPPTWMYFVSVDAGDEAILLF